MIGEPSYLPFDLDQVVDSLRYERYQKCPEGRATMQSATASAYYFVRPLLPVPFANTYRKFAFVIGTNYPFRGGPSILPLKPVRKVAVENAEVAISRLHSFYLVLAGRCFQLRNHDS